MNIVIDARIINSSTGRYVERLLHYLQEIDSKNLYTVLIPTKDLEYWKPHARNFSVIAADFKSYSFREQYAYLKFINSLKADLVHFTMPQQPLLYRRPHVTTIHDLTLLRTYNSDKNWLLYHLKQLVGRVVFFIIARTSRHIITPSEYTKFEYVEYALIPDTKVSVTYESADAIPGEPTEVPLPSKEFILYVGQQSDYKNIKRLIQSHAELRLTHPKLVLVLAGSKNAALTANEKWVQKHGFEGVIFTGRVTDEQLLWLYSHTAAYIFPSLMEGFGLPGLEAMRAGAPVVSSNRTSLPEIYGDAAHYFDPKNVGDMTTKIGQVLTDVKLRDKMITAGHARAQEFSWERMARKTLEIYESA